MVSLVMERVVFHRAVKEDETRDGLWEIDLHTII